MFSQNLIHSRVNPVPKLEEEEFEHLLLVTQYAKITLGDLLIDQLHDYVNIITIYTAVFCERQETCLTIWVLVVESGTG